MIAAGLGLRPGTPASDLRLALEAALTRLSLDPADLGCLASAAARAAEPGLSELARDLRLPLVAIPDAALRDAGGGCATRSARVVHLFGVGSVAEAAALAAAGAGARLILPRLAVGPATCALAARDVPKAIP